MKQDTTNTVQPDILTGWRYSVEHEEVTQSRPGVIEGSKRICRVSDFDKTPERVKLIGELIASAPQLQAQVKVLLKDNTKLIDENTGLREDAKYLRELIREYSGKMLVNLSGVKVNEFLKEQITQPENDLIPGHHEKPGNNENIL